MSNDLEQQALFGALSAEEQHEMAEQAMRDAYLEMNQVIEALQKGQIPGRLVSRLPADADQDPELSTLLRDFYEDTLDATASLVAAGDITLRYIEGFSANEILEFCDAYASLIRELGELLHDRFKGRY